MQYTYGQYLIIKWGRWGCDCMEAGFTSISAMYSIKYVCQCRAAGLLFSLGSLISFTNKTDIDDIPITEILFEVVLSTQTP